MFSFFSVPLKTKCYGKYGCFDNKLSFTSLPQSLSNIGTEFRLFTRTSPFFHKVDDSDANKLRTSQFDGRNNTVIIVHGFLGKREKIRFNITNLINCSQE